MSRFLSVLVLTAGTTLAGFFGLAAAVVILPLLFWIFQ